MANEQAWSDLEQVRDYYRKVMAKVQEFKSLCDEISQFKNAALDDVKDRDEAGIPMGEMAPNPRKIQLALVLKEYPNLDVPKIAAMIVKVQKLRAYLDTIG